MVLSDQTGDPIQISSIPVSIYSSNGSLYEQTQVVSQNQNSMGIPYDASPGQWNITFSYNGTTSNDIFNVSDLSSIQILLNNQTLVIKNTGNIPYLGNVSVLIGQQTNYTLSVDLGVDDSKNFVITAPNGNYTLSAMDDQGLTELGSSYLTGGAIAVKQSTNSTSFFSDIGLWVWFVIIVLLLAVAVYYYRRSRNRRIYGSSSGLTSLKSKFVPYNGSSVHSKEAVSNVKTEKLETYTPESSVVSSSSDDNKGDVAIIALKIKNSVKLKDAQSSAFLTIEHLLQNARMAKANVYDQDSFKVIIFSSKLTKKPELEVYTEAVKVGIEIDTALKEFNKKYAIKIDYGIGGHVGQMFVENVQGKVKFTSSGNTVIVAKNAAEKANNGFIISSVFHRKVYNIVKVEQNSSGLYLVNSVINRTQNSQFIQRFMNKGK